jgi:hypothetical protein
MESKAVQSFGGRFQILSSRFKVLVQGSRFKVQSKGVSGFRFQVSGFPEVNSGQAPK